MSLFVPFLVNFYNMRPKKCIYLCGILLCVQAVVSLSYSAKYDLSLTFVHLPTFTSQLGI
jgi:hypothetical protein